MALNINDTKFLEIAEIICEEGLSGIDKAVQKVKQFLQKKRRSICKHFKAALETTKRLKYLWEKNEELFFPMPD